MVPLILMFLTSPATVPRVVALTSSPDHLCSADILHKQFGYLATSFNTETAISLATTSAQFKAALSGLTYSLSSLFQRFSFDANCSATWTDANLVFSVADGNAVTRQIIVKLDPALTQVTAVSVDSSIQYYGYSNNWSGYSFWGSSNPASTSIGQTHSFFNIPVVSAPWGGACWWTGPCHVAAWTGVSPYVTGYDQNNCPKGCIAQAGSTSTVSCNIFGCSTSYNVWYEFLPDGSVTCDSHYGGDGVDVTVHQIINQWEIDVTTTSGGGCVGYSSWSHGVPHYAQYIVERIGTLAKFSQVTFSNS